MVGLTVIVYALCTGHLSAQQTYLSSKAKIYGLEDVAMVLNQGSSHLSANSLAPVATHRIYISSGAKIYGLEFMDLEVSKQEPKLPETLGTFYVAHGSLHIGKAYPAEKAEQPLTIAGVLKIEASKNTTKEDKRDDSFTLRACPFRNWPLGNSITRADYCCAIIRGPSNPILKRASKCPMSYADLGNIANFLRGKHTTTYNSFYSNGHKQDLVARRYLTRPPPIEA